MEADSCAWCGRREADERWLYVTLARASQDVDCEYDEAELSFCRREHAGEYLLTREPEFPEVTPADRSAGTRVDTFFLGCGLLAIVLSVIGLVAVLLWIF